MTKRLILFSMLFLLAVATQAQTDSIKSETLPEVVVNADGQIEMASAVFSNKHNENSENSFRVFVSASIFVLSPRLSICLFYNLAAIKHQSLRWKL